MHLGAQIEKVAPAKMLHAGIAKSFHQKREKVLAEEGVHMVATTKYEAGSKKAFRPWLK